MKYTACSSDVCGDSWLLQYSKLLNKDELGRFKKMKGWRSFKFGGGERSMSKWEAVVPATIGEQPVDLKVDVIESKLPLLISLKTRKLADTVLDTTTDTTIIAEQAMSFSGKSLINLAVM